MNRPDPATYYAAQATIRQQERDRLGRIDSLVTIGRGSAFLLASLVAWLAITTDWMPIGWIWFPAVGFVVLAVFHGRVIRHRDNAERALRYLQDRQERVGGSWRREPLEPRPSVPPEHLYAEDLDVFRDGGVFDLLGPVGTSLGANTLGQWLTVPSSPSALRHRHRAISILQGAPELGERLLLSAQGARAVNIDRLLVWATTPGTATTEWSRVVAFAVPLFSLGSVIWAFFGGPPLLPVMLFLGQGVLARVLKSQVTAALDDIEPALQALGSLAPVFGVMERGPTVNPSGADGGELPTPSYRRSAELLRLRRMVRLLDSRGNQLFAFVAPALLWTTQIGLWVAKWRAVRGAQLPGWCDRLGEYDACVALARYAWENPTDVLPEFLDEPHGRVRATQLAHPLLPPRAAIRNDVELGPPQMMLISGSNMAGKSTLLRALGVNIVLAQAGSVVRATSFQLTPLTLGTSIGVHDSLLDGRSRFHAEVLRLRTIVDACQRDPAVCFLLDELLSGTNSADRVAGATAILSHLVHAGAIGLVSTHDLALARAVAFLGDQAVQAHFEDQMDGDQMTFDYILRPGPLPRGNAMAVMRLVGLPVPGHSQQPAPGD